MRGGDASLSCFFAAVAGAGHLQDDRVVDQPVDGCGGGHGILENADPIAEDQVAGDEDALAFVPLGQEGEEHLHFVAALLDVADVVEDHGVIDVHSERRRFAWPP